MFSFAIPPQLSRESSFSRNEGKAEMGGNPFTSKSYSLANNGALCAGTLEESLIKFL